MGGARRARRALYLHPGAPPADHWKVLDGRPELYGATWNWAAETGGHALRIIYGGVFDRHPGAEVAGLQATDQRPGSILHRRAHGNL